MGMIDPELRTNLPSYVRIDLKILVEEADGR